MVMVTVWVVFQFNSFVLTNHTVTVYYGVIFNERFKIHSNHTSNQVQPRTLQYMFDLNWNTSDGRYPVEVVMGGTLWRW